MKKVGAVRQRLKVMVARARESHRRSCTSMRPGNCKFNVDATGPDGQVMGLCTYAHQMKDRQWPIRVCDARHPSGLNQVRLCPHFTLRVSAEEADDQFSQEMMRLTQQSDLGELTLRHPLIAALVWVLDGDYGHPDPSADQDVVSETETTSESDDVFLKSTVDEAAAFRGSPAEGVFEEDSFETGVVVSSVVEEEEDDDDDDDDLDSEWVDEEDEYEDEDLFKDEQVDPFEGKATKDLPSSSLDLLSLYRAYCQDVYGFDIGEVDLDATPPITKEATTRVDFQIGRFSGWVRAKRGEAAGPASSLVAAGCSPSSAESGELPPGDRVQVEPPS